MSQLHPANQTVDILKQYVNLKIDIILLNISQKLSNAASYLVFALIMGFIFLFISLFLSLSLSAWLAVVLDMPGMGNMIVSFIYIILGTILFVFKDKLILGPIKSRMSQEMDLTDLHKDSSIGKLENIDEAIVHIKHQLKNTEESIDKNLDDIKKYYSFDELKNRFLQSLVNNPKNIISTLLIIRDIIKSRKSKL